MTKNGRLVAAGFHSLRRHRLRTAFVMLSTFVGVAALTLVVAVGRGAQRDMLERFERMFSGSSVMIMAGSMSHSEGPRASAVTTLTLEDLAALEAQVEAVVLWDPWQMVGTREVVWGGRSRAVSVAGHSERGEVAWNRGAARGSFFSGQDVASAARVALVGQTLAGDLFGETDPIGEEIRIGTVPFRVIGVLEIAGSDPHGTDRDNEIHVPVTTAQRRLQNVDHVDAAKLLVAEGADLDAVTAEIERVLRERHGLPAGADNDFAMFTPRQVVAMIESSGRVFTLFLPLLAGAFLVIAGIVVANLMYMAVNERRAEIGLRKAVGARGRDVRLQLLVECAAGTLAGGGAAVAVSWLGLEVARAQQVPMVGSMPWQAAALGLVSALIVGLLAGLTPARRAAALDPAKALR
jgi:putative ABC transport system permease protein